MQNIKNFKIVEPTSEQLKTYATADGAIPVFFQSEDGQDWYECHKLFSDNTIKIMYDNKGVITSVVDKPIPERGNTYAVSMFYPDGMSVAELSLNDYPEGVTIDGSWMFSNGAIVPVPVDNVAVAEEEKALRLNEAEVVITPLERATKYGIATDQEKQLLEDWEVYTVLLNRVDASQAPNIQWPEKPGKNSETTS
jgi:hypothetical protein